MQIRSSKRAARKRRESQLKELAHEWNECSEGARSRLYREWPELYKAVSYLVRSEEAGLED